MPPPTVHNAHFRERARESGTARSKMTLPVRPLHLKGFGLNCAQISHCFARVYATTPHLSSAKACTITMESDTSAHVLRFTGFGHRRERRRLEDAFLTNAAATVRSVGAS